MKEPTGTIHFHKDRQSVKGIIALVLGILCTIGTGVMLVLSTNSGGGSGLSAGTVGLFLMAAGLAGLCLALRALYERDVVHGIPVAALIVNGLLLIFYISIYIIGLV